MTDQTIVTQLLQTYGSLGFVIAVAGYALRYLHTLLVASQEKRIADAQAASAQLLGLVEAQHSQLEMLAKSIDSGADASREMRMLIESLIAERGYNRLPPVSVPRRPTGGG